MAPSLRLLPGNACDGAVFGPLLTMLRERPAVSVADLETAPSFQAMTDAALAYDGDIVLCGLSMGGIVAQAAAVAAPQRIRGLILIGTTARSADADEQAWRERLLAQDAPSAFAAFVGRVPRSWFHRAPPGAVDAAMAMVNRVGPEAYIRQQRCLGERPDLLSALPSVQCPVLVISGACDRVLPPSESATIAQALRHARLENVPACGHVATLDAPELLAPLIDRFLRETGVREAPSA